MGKKYDMRACLWNIKRKYNYDPLQNDPKKGEQKEVAKKPPPIAREERLERPTLGFGDRCSTN